MVLVVRGMFTLVLSSLTKIVRHRLGSCQLSGAHAAVAHGRMNKLEG